MAVPANLEDILQPLKEAVEVLKSAALAQNVILQPNQSVFACSKCRLKPRVTVNTLALIFSQPEGRN